MNDNNDPVDKLQTIIDFCRTIDFNSLSEILFADEAPEQASVHGMPRLSILISGSEEFDFYTGNTRKKRRLDAPAIYYCTRNGYLWSKQPGVELYSHKALSFCYLPEYIRISLVNTMNPDVPESWNTLIHSNKPLSAGGMALLNAFEMLYIQGDKELARKVLNEVWNLTLQELANTESVLNGTYNSKIWSKIVFYLRNNRTQRLTRENTAKIFNISPGYLSRLARRYAGRDFITLITEYKLEHAATLLKTTRASIDEISDECGFKYRSYFDRRFKNHYGMTPREYRDR